MNRLEPVRPEPVEEKRVPEEPAQKLHLIKGGDRESDTQPARKEWPLGIKYLYLFGFYVEFSILVPTGLGFWLDMKAAHHFPSFALIGLALGMIIAFSGVYRMVRPHLETVRNSYPVRSPEVGK